MLSSLFLSILQQVVLSSSPASAEVCPPASTAPHESPQPTELPLEKRTPVLSAIKTNLESATPGSAESEPATIAWYLVHAKPRQEGTALVNLERQGYQCYLPQLRLEKIRRRKAEIVTEPMFPRYLFVRLDTSGSGQSWSPIRSTLGVSQLVNFGGRPAKVEDQLVDLLRSREQAHAVDPLFRNGEAVVITDGPFAGLEAIYQTADAERRSMILLEILSKPVPMRIDAACLRKVA